MDIKILTILITVVCLKNQLVACDDEANYCYSDDEHPYLLFDTKTAYHFSHGFIKNTTVPNCTPKQIWLLIRHGTRNPSGEEIKSMKRNLPRLQDSILENESDLCAKDLENLRAWTYDKTLKHRKKYLTEQGEEDLRSLAARFKNYFPQLLHLDSADALANKYKFRSTDTQRTVLSMERFIEGLFGNVTLNSTEVVPTSEDKLLKAYKTCKAWKNETKNSASNAEMEAFENSQRYDKLINDISKRLGFQHNLTLDEVMDMYTACVFEKAWHVDKVSPWCAVFTEEELKVIEYKSDLYYYYHTGYGQKMSSRIGCPPLQDMFNRFSKLENGESDEPQGVFYFSHSSSVQLLLTAMKIAEDSIPLKASNYETMENRKWSTSRLVPFAANLAAVFYKCDSSNKVRLYLNEVPVDYEGCEKGVCEWDYLKEKLGPNAFNCNIDFCNK
ncbi:multiple inositol polyphosphate phosphatase 1 [Megachile rotundata]|uniref:multiple inositol polyphosphate phosphatase 1 n=1 Tax=Megachile rotundata TaxID=143995 RepID=UPI003FD3447B